MNISPIFLFLLLILINSSAADDNLQIIRQRQMEFDKECDALIQENIERFSNNDISLKQVLKDIQEFVKKGKENQDQMYNEMNTVSNELKEIINRLEKDSEADVSEEIKSIRETTTKINNQYYLSGDRYLYALKWVKLARPSVGKDRKSISDLFDVGFNLAGENLRLGEGVYFAKDYAEQIENYKSLEDIKEIDYQLKQVKEFNFKTKIDETLTLIKGVIDRIEEKVLNDETVDQVVE